MKRALAVAISLVVVAAGLVVGVIWLTQDAAPADPSPAVEEEIDGSPDVASDSDLDAPAPPPTTTAPSPVDGGEDEATEAEAPEEEDPQTEPIMPDGPPSDERTLEHVTTIYGDISPKSVVANHRGTFFAQNMMYRHTMTVYDRHHELVATIPDMVDPTEFGFEGPDAELHGSPVEMAFTPDGAYAYVSNYKMYGPGYARGGTDTCSPSDGYDDSLLYRVDVESLQIDQLIPVGSVPKYVAVTPDSRFVLVSNWCSYDLSIIDVEAAAEIGRVPLGRYPRGIAVTADATTAYVALMGTLDIAILDLTAVETLDRGEINTSTLPFAEDPPQLDDVHTDTLSGVGRSPRHLVLGPDEEFLYATLNGEGVVVRIDLETGETIRVSTGSAPRSMDIAADGKALYVVNYHSDTVTKVLTEDMTVQQTIGVDPRPIGITYDRATAEVWVAHYSGSIRVLQDR